MPTTVLIVDDSEDDVFLLKRLLNRSGVQNPIHVSMTAKEANAYLDGEPPFSDREKYPLPSVIILDLKMPDVDGFQLLDWCRRHKDCKEVLIVVLSGFGDVRTIRRAYDLGAESFLTKPCQPADLDNLIATYPEHWQRRKT